MKVQGRERIAFNFIDVIKSFASSNDVIDDDIEKELNEIIKAENSSEIAKLEKATDPTRFEKNRKGGARRKKGGLDVQTVEAKQVKAKTNAVKEAGEKERDM